MKFRTRLCSYKFVFAYRLSCFYYYRIILNKRFSFDYNVYRGRLYEFCPLVRMFIKLRYAILSSVRICVCWSKLQDN